MADIKVEKVGGLTEEPIGGFNHLNIKVALVEWFSSIAAPKPLQDIDTPANEATTFEELAEISGTHTFNAGYGFMNIEALQEKIDIEATPLGEKKGKLFENKANVVVAGSNAKLLGFARWIKNKDVIVLLQEFENGQLRQVGAERFAAAIEVTGKIEGAPEGGNTQSYVISDKQVYQAPIYKGTVTVMPTQV